MYRFKRLHTKIKPHHIHIFEVVLEVIFVFLLFTPQATAVTRFTSRSLFLFDTTPGAVAKYKISFTYTTATTIGSLDLLFCTDPIPQDPCITPPGLDASNATLVDQGGVTGYSVSSRSTNHVVLSRTPGVIGNTLSAYTLDGIVNPTDTTYSFAIRISDYASTDATGPSIDIGSVLSSAGYGVNIATQVPPMLIFCVAHEVSDNCTQASGGNFTDMGELDAKHTLTATSQMAAGTNASRGYAITAYGTTMEAGTSVINNLTTPTASAPGNNQFGINLVANSAPAIGQDPDGSFANANPAPSYSVPNQYIFNNGDVVASAPHVSLFRRYTVSYIVNVSPNLRPGVYTTTITYICSGRF